MSEHAIMPCNITMLNIDVGIRLIVDYVNAFNGLFTRWSCEGNYCYQTLDNRDQPYCLFYAERMQDLEPLIEDVFRRNWNARIEIEIPHVPQTSEFIKYRFILRFRTKKWLISPIVQLLSESTHLSEDERKIINNWVDEQRKFLDEVRVEY